MADYAATVTTRNIGTQVTPHGAIAGHTEDRTMNAEVKHEAGYWNVYVDGIRTVDRESFAVADRVRYYLEHPECSDFSESSEVAHSIRQYFHQAA